MIRNLVVTAAVAAFMAAASPSHALFFGSLFCKPCAAPAPAPCIVAPMAPAYSPCPPLPDYMPAYKHHIPTYTK